MANSASTPSCFLNNNNKIIKNHPADAKYTCYDMRCVNSYLKNKWHSSYKIKLFTLMSYKSGNNNINQKLQDLQYCSPFLDVNYDDLFLPDFVFCNDCPPLCIQSLQFITRELAHISVVTNFSFEFWVQFFIQTLFCLYRGCWSFAKCCNAYNDGRRTVS